MEVHDMKKTKTYIGLAVALVMLGAIIGGFSFLSNMTVDGRDYPVTLTEQEENHPLAKYYDDRARIPTETLENMVYKSNDEAVSFENINDILGAESGFEDGFTVLEDGTGYVAVNTQFPGSSIEMLDWWFDWVGYEAIRYKIWYPGAHSQALYEDVPHTEGTPYSISAYIEENPEGKVKHTIEAIVEGGELSNLYITFVDPEKFGIDTSLLGDDQWALCGEVKNGSIETVKMVHFLRVTDDGVEMRSRFWMGQDQNGLIKKIASTEESLEDMFYHCAKEYNQLASFLPEVYDTYAIEGIE